MSVTLRGASGINLSGVTTSTKINLPVTTITGDVIIVVAAAQGSQSFNGGGITGATWVRPISNYGVAPTVTLFAAYNVPAGTTTFQFSQITGTLGSASIAVYSGLQYTSSPVVQTSLGYYGNGSYFSNPAQLNNLVIQASAYFQNGPQNAIYSGNANGAIANYYLMSSTLVNNARYNQRYTAIYYSIVNYSYIYYVSGDGAAASAFPTFSTGVVEFKALSNTNTEHIKTSTVVSDIYVNTNQTQTEQSKISTNKAITQLSFSTPGTTTWTVPTGVKFILVELYGGGGAGGTSTIFVSRTNSSTGGNMPGGYGGYYAGSVLSVSAGTNYKLVIGAGGVAPSTYSQGGNGGNSYLQDSSGTTNLIVAPGGNGAYTSSSTQNNTTPLGSLWFAGGSGGAYSINGNYAGGGGAVATNLAIGISAVNQSGGISLFPNGVATGLGNGGNGGNGGTLTPTNGNPGVFPGGGGGGAGANNTTSAVGGNGASGYAQITYITPNNGSGMTLLGIG